MKVRFTLRHVLVLLVPTCVVMSLLGYVMRSGLRQESVITEIETMGGEVWYASDSARKDWWEQALSTCWGRRCIGTVVGVAFENKRLNDGQLKRIADISTIEVLLLDDVEWESDEGLTRIALLKSLNRLRIRSFSMTSRGIESVSRCRSLEAFTLTAPAVNDDAIVSLSAMRRLGSLGLGTSISVRGIAIIEQQLPGCRISVWKVNSENLSDS